MGAPTWVKLAYRVTNVGNGDYYLQLEPENNSLAYHLPSSDLVKLQAVGVSVSSTDDYVGMNKIDGHDLGELFCQRLHDVLSESWDFSLGLPLLRFTGETDHLSDEFKQRAVVVVFTHAANGHERAAQLASWANAVPFLVKFSLLSQPVGVHFRFITSDHETARRWLQMQVADTDTKQVPKRRQDIDVIHAGWYPHPEWRQKLLAQAKAKVDEFLVMKNLNLYVPAFMVVSAHHIRRIQRATQILTDIYHPHFLMPLPLTVDGAPYTVLFPVSRPISRKALRRHK